MMFRKRWVDVYVAVAGTNIHGISQSVKSLKFLVSKRLL